MKRKLAVVCALALLLSGCPQKPNPYCPNNTCVHAPTTTQRK